MREALAEFGYTLDQVADDALLRDSPCADWTVGDVVEHVTGVTDKFTRWVTGADRPPSRSGDVRARYIQSAAAATAAWDRCPTRTDRIVLGFGAFDAAAACAINTFDLVVHRWDVAVGAALPITMNEELCEAVLPTAVEIVTDEQRRAGQYGHAVRPPRRARPSVALLALTGRRP